MLHSIPKYLLLFLLFQPVLLHAQNISGTWEGGMDDEFLQISIELKDTVLCGYTHDFVFANPESYCRAEFTGYYDKDKQEGMITGTSFIENHERHSLMMIRLLKSSRRNDTLWVQVRVKSFLSMFFGIGATNTFLTRTSTTTDIRKWMQPCFPKAKKRAGQPDKAIPPVISPKKITPRRDSSHLPVTQFPKSTPKDSGVLARSMIVRRQTEQSRLVINTDHINLKLYDNGVVDNDTISVFYNGRLLVSHQRLSEKAVELNIDLDKNTTIHEITLYAENLGGIPPNTALIVVTAAGKRYELRSKANLEENAVLIFEKN